MYAVNLRTRWAQEARDGVEYDTPPGGSWMSDLRIKIGRKDLLGIRLRCLGREMGGPWQIG